MDARYKLFLQIMDSMNLAYVLMREYDSLPHQYGNNTLYQAESHIIQMIGQNPGITVTEISQKMGKTKSACSQIIRKLREKNWVEQTRNEKNNREFNLGLTEDGWAIFHIHEKIDKECYQRAYSDLSQFSEEELQTYLQIQQRLNQTFGDDVEITKASF